MILSFSSLKMKPLNAFFAWITTWLHPKKCFWGQNGLCDLFYKQGRFILEKMRPLNAYFCLSNYLGTSKIMFFFRSSGSLWPILKAGPFLWKKINKTLIGCFCQSNYLGTSETLFLEIIRVCLTHFKSREIFFRKIKWNLLMHVLAWVITWILHKQCFWRHQGLCDLF